MGRVLERSKIAVEFEKVTTPEPDQQSILDYLKVETGTNRGANGRANLGCEMEAAWRSRSKSR